MNLRKELGEALASPLFLDIGAFKTIANENTEAGK